MIRVDFSLCPPQDSPVKNLAIILHLHYIIIEICFFYLSKAGVNRIVINSGFVVLKK